MDKPARSICLRDFLHMQERWDEADVEYVKPASGNRAAAKSESGGVDYGSSSPDQQQASPANMPASFSLSCWKAMVSCAAQAESD